MDLNGNNHLNGIHHVTAVSARIGQNADFFTRILGLRLVKKSVNQDDTSAYHLFYADKIGSPGTDMTFFDWPRMAAEQRGTDSVVETIFRVPNRDALDYWLARLDEHEVKNNGIETFAGQGIIHFEDREGQRLALMDDGRADYNGEIWDESDVPIEHAIRGFYAVKLSIPQLGHIEPILTQLLGYQETARHDGVVIYETGDGGPGRQIWVIEEPDKPYALQGAGAVHHVAFSVNDVSHQRFWHERIANAGLGISHVIDRFWFKSIYFRISRGILFEIATDGPGFAVDEAPEALGEKLILPPFLEGQRAQIEANLKPIVISANE